MSIGKLEPFNLILKQWPAYIRRVDQYILINKTSEDLKVPLLITVVGEETYALMCDLCAPRFPDNLTYNELVQLVTDHLEPQRSEMVERHIFRQRRQRPTESLTEYLQALKHLAATCNFGSCPNCSTLEDNLRDQFVSGLANDALRSRIFAEKTLKYKEAVELALALEAAEKHAGCPKPKPKTMPIDFYYAPYLPQCWSTLMVAEALDLELNLKVIKTSEKENFSPEYLKMNPQHTLLTIIDNGFVLWEPYAITTYFVNKYAKGSPLYPEDPQARALVDQRLYFDARTLYRRYMDYLYNQMSGLKLKKLNEALGFVKTFLEGRQYIAGDNLTLADYKIGATLSIFSSVGIDAFKTPRIKAWFERLKTAPGFSKSEEGAQLFRKWVKGWKKTK